MPQACNQPMGEIMFGNAGIRQAFHSIITGQASKKLMNSINASPATNVMKKFIFDPLS
jgi:hypothetical protein